MDESKYSRFSDPVHLWDDIDQFLLDTDWRDGIHAIRLEDGSTLDLLLRGNVLSRDDKHSVWPVFFNGAVDRDKGNPPFFSGSAMAAEVEAPVISIADPTLTSGNRLGIGWYTGLPGSKAQDTIRLLLEGMKHGLRRELALVGGSAGGFAALYFAARTGSAAFVWNPQVDLLRYVPAHVRSYLTTILDDAAWASQIAEILRDTPEVDHNLASLELQARGIAHTVEDTAPIPRLLYLQNQSDSHETRHAAPLRARDGFLAVSEGIYRIDNRVMGVGHYADGHRQPPREIIRGGLQAVLDRRSDLDQAAVELLRLAAAAR